MTRNKHDQLDDSAYIHWAEKEEWSLTQAVYLLHGLVPPEPKFTNKRLLKEFPCAKGLLQHYPKLNKKKIKKEFPDTWIFLAAMIYHMDVPDCWVAIFPQWIKGNDRYYFGDSPDYRRFLQVLGADTDTELEELVRFTLDLGDKKMANPPKEFNYLLNDMATRLDIETNSPKKLRKWRVRPRRFMERCPEDKFAYDSECLKWYSLLKSKSELADWLEVSSNVKEERPVQINEAVVNQVPKSKNTKVNTLIQKDNNSLPKMGGDARGAQYARLKQQAIKLYREGQFKSKRQASKDLYQPIKIYAYDEKFKIHAPQPSTIYGWLLEN